MYLTEICRDKKYINLQPPLWSPKGNTQEKKRRIMLSLTSYKLQYLLEQINGEEEKYYHYKSNSGEAEQKSITSK